MTHRVEILTCEQIEWCRKWIPSFAKNEPQARAAGADSQASRVRFAEQLAAQKNELIPSAAG
jgi:hypothetical protein